MFGKLSQSTSLS